MNNIANKTFNKDIMEMDGLRGIAIICVIALHTIPHYFKLGSWFKLVGTLAVPLFFSISGFCIVFGIMNRYLVGRPTSAKDFLIRRWKRIYPPYAIAAFIFLIKALLVAKHSGCFPSARELTEMIFFNATLSQVFMGKILVVNPAFWSLCVETQFYFLTAIVIASFQFFGAKISRVVFTFILIFSSCVFFAINSNVIRMDHDVWFMFFPHYIFNFLLGGVLAFSYFVFLNKIKTCIPVIYIVLASCLILAVTGPFNWSIVLLMLLGSLSSHFKIMNFISMPLRLGFLRYLGERSYSIYLMHGFGIAVFSTYGASIFQKNHILGILILCTNWGVAILIGVVYFKLVESRFMRSVGTPKVFNR